MECELHLHKRRGISWPAARLSGYWERLVSCTLKVSSSILFAHRFQNSLSYVIKNEVSCFFCSYIWTLKTEILQGNKARLEHIKVKDLPRCLQTKERIKSWGFRGIDFQLRAFLWAHGFCLERLVFMSTRLWTQVALNCLPRASSFGNTQRLLKHLDSSKASERNLYLLIYSYAQWECLQWRTHMLVEKVHTTICTLFYQQVKIDQVLAGNRFWTVDILLTPDTWVYNEH